MQKENNCCGCAAAAQPVDDSRRRVFKIAAAGIAAGIGLSRKSGDALAAASVDGPVAGDFLVDDNAEGELKPITVDDLAPLKPLVVYPLNPKTNKPKADSRLNRIVLIRMNAADFSAETKKDAAGDVLAFSAICTHQGCDVKTWMSADKALACFCHGSKFQPLDAGAVVLGPATRAMPVLPIRLDGKKIVVAAGFKTPPGMG